VLDEYGEEHRRTGKWIVYTSADSVFQIAAHEDTVPLSELYAACATARELCRGEHGVSRIIARPFVGSPGAWKRTSNRRDFSLPPPGPTLLDRLAERQIPRVGVGKVDDLFAARGITSIHTATNADAYALIEGALRAMHRGLLLANVIEFDQTWGHRNDVAGFHTGLLELDQALPRMMTEVRENDLVIFTADHGNDPTTPSTDHSREVVPLLAFGPRVRPASLGRRRTFADIGQTVAEFLEVPALPAGTSFLSEVWLD
jgi:phosphopentomutase